MKMTTDEFCTKHNACTDGRNWALSVSPDMAVVWDAMIEQRKIEWLCWTAGREGVLTEKQLRLLACQFVRETPLADGRKVWDLLADERSRNAVVVAERFANGEATESEFDAARAAARAAARDAARAAARDAAWAAARDAARDAAWAAAWAAAGDAAGDAQCEMFRQFDNPFAKEPQ